MLIARIGHNPRPGMETGFASGRGWNDPHLDTIGTTLPYCSFFPEDGMLLAQGETVSHHLPAIIDIIGDANAAAQRSQVDHRALLPEKGMGLRQRHRKRVNKLKVLILKYPMK